MPVRSTPVRVADVDLNLQKNGLIYDRTEHRAFRFVTELTVEEYAGHWQRISDAETIDGELHCSTAQASAATQATRCC